MSLTFANKITISRILIVPIFVLCVMSYVPGKEVFRYWALGVFAVAVLTDFLDGYLARLLRQESRWGAVLDPIADKVLITSAFVSLYMVNRHFDAVQFPAWLVVSVLLRDFILVAGATLLFVLNRPVEIQPTVWGKITTFFQVLSVFGFLMQVPLSVYLWPLTVALTVFSGLDYVKTGMQSFHKRKIA